MKPYPQASARFSFWVVFSVVLMADFVTPLISGDEEEEVEAQAASLVCQCSRNKFIGSGSTVSTLQALPRRLSGHIPCNLKSRVYAHLENPLRPTERCALASSSTCHSYCLQSLLIRRLQARIIGCAPWPFCQPRQRTFKINADIATYF